MGHLWAFIHPCYSPMNYTRRSRFRAIFGKINKTKILPKKPGANTFACCPP